MNPFISVIIPHKNDSDRLQLCIEALSRQTYPKELYEIIVIDNGSDKNHLDKINSLQRSSQINFLSEFKKGSYAARNRGLLEARGSYIAFTDSDCIPHLDWIEKGMNNITESEDYGFISGKINMFFKIEDSPNTFELYDHLFYLDQESYIKMNFGVTANLFTSRNIIDKAGLFNDNLVTGGDVEWCRRVYKKGFKIKYCHDVLIKHPARNTFSDFKKKQLRLCKGDFDLHKLDGEKNFTILYKTLFHLLPPVITGYRFLKSEKLEKVSDIRTKFKVLLLHVFVRYLKVFENIRLLTGFNSRDYS